VYVEPNTYRAFMTTGKWPDGALIVKEFAITNVSDVCGGAPAHICKRRIGKDSSRTGTPGSTSC